ncbi:esterase family protein [Bacillus carboniphilus]|uniref:Esterase family protein n=1 Tax=Bacillus carboniphilus TaxID=86663 RepID=A0ABY9JZF4_9BACI|nr:esterase family protein [Bacillus carboniphilus]WLR42980.1 esterase family protein [Bacillus carboniphilus]
MNVKVRPLQEINFYSNELNEELSLLVYLPVTYSPLYKYNLLVAQDGQDYFKLGRIARFTEQLLEYHEIENMIIVGIPYKSVDDRRTKYHPNSPTSKAYSRFLAHELIPFLDKEYPTYQMGQARALIGDSLGGTISLMTAISYPNIFGKVMLQSPFVNEKVINSVKQFNYPDLLSIYHQIGLEETSVKTTDDENVDFLTPNRQLNKVFNEKGFQHIYEEFEGDHRWTYWQPLLKKVLQTMMN